MAFGAEYFHGEIFESFHCSFKMHAKTSLAKMFVQEKNHLNGKVAAQQSIVRQLYVIKHRGAQFFKRKFFV